MFVIGCTAKTKDTTMREYKDSSALVLQWQKEKDPIQKELLFEEVLGCFYGAIDNYCTFDIRRRGESDDMKQEMAIVLLMAMERYKESMNVKFSTYAFHYFKLGRQNWGKTAYTIRTPAGSGVQLSYWSLDKPKDKSDKSESNVLPSERIADDFNWDHIDNIIEYKYITAGLDEREMFILTKRAEGNTLSQISSKINVTKERVRQIEDAIYDKLMRKYAKTNFKKKFNVNRRG